MNKLYDLYFENLCIAERYTEKELLDFFQDIELDYGWAPDGENIVIYDGRYSLSSRYSFFEDNQKDNL